MDHGAARPNTSNVIHGTTSNGHRPASPQAIEAAIAAYNLVWEAAKDVDAHTAPKIRREAMTAALNAAVPYIDPFIDGYMRQRVEAAP